MNSGWIVEIDPKVKKQLMKLDANDRILINYFIERHLIGIDNPRRIGHGLSGKFAGKWRYRVGKYRLIANIMDHKLVIQMIAIDKRDQIYK